MLQVVGPARQSRQHDEMHTRMFTHFVALIRKTPNWQDPVTKLPLSRSVDLICRMRVVTAYPIMGPQRFTHAPLALHGYLCYARRRQRWELLLDSLRLFTLGNVAARSPPLISMAGNPLPADRYRGSHGWSQGMSTDWTWNKGYWAMPYI